MEFVNLGYGRHLKKKRWESDDEVLTIASDLALVLNVNVRHIERLVPL